MAFRHVTLMYKRSGNTARIADGTMERFEEQLEVIRTANHERRPCRSCL